LGDLRDAIGQLLRARRCRGILAIDDDLDLSQSASVGCLVALAYLHGTTVDLDAVQLGDSLDGASGIGEDHASDSTALAIGSVHQKNLLHRGNCLLEVVLWK
jgi:hypothetical protein